MKIKTLFLVTLGLVSLSSCRAIQLPESKVIKVDSEPRGAKVVFQGKVICESTPADVVVPLTYNGGRTAKQFANNNKLEFTFILPGYETATETISPNGSRGIPQYPDAVFHYFKPKADRPNNPRVETQTVEERVSRDNPGSTKMEDSIIRWYFDSDPRGARIFWRVISSVPAEVKNTNETYLTSTPYEETRGFNIPGLTYSNSKDVTIEIKVSKRGYIDQVKRYNVRQALDQQEISGFFELVPAEN